MVFDQCPYTETVGFDDFIFMDKALFKLIAIDPFFTLELLDTTAEDTLVMYTSSEVLILPFLERLLIVVMYVARI